MPDTSEPCDTRRLRLSLEDRLTDLEQAELAAHLEGCEPCRAELERLAAASGLWGEARALRGEPEPGMDRTIGLAAEDEPGDELEDEAWLAFLDPPDPDRPGDARAAGGLRGRRGPGPGGHGHRAQGPRPGARADGGDQGADAGAGARADGPPPVRPRGPRRGGRRARAHRGDPRRRRVPRPALPRHAVHPRPLAPGPARRLGPARGEGDPPDRHPGGAGAGGGPRPGGGAPRHQAGEHPARELRRAGQAHRLRPGPGDGRRQPHAERRHRRDARSTWPPSRPGASRSTPAPTCSPSARCSTRWPSAGRRSGPTRRWPCSSASATTAIARSASSTPTSPTGSRRSIDRLLAKDPADRFQTAAEVADLLEHGLAHVQQPTAVPRPVVAGVHAQSSPEFEFDLPVAKAPRALAAGWPWPRVS